MHPDLHKAAGLFGRLPPELRNRIYEDILVDCTHIRGCLQWRRWGSMKWPISRQAFLTQFLQPPLARTCRLIQDEALSVWLGGNVFAIDLASPYRVLLKEWLASLHRNGRATLFRRLYIRRDQTHSWIRMLPQLLDAESRFELRELAPNEIEAYIGDGQYLRLTFLAERVTSEGSRGQSSIQRAT